MEVLIYVLVLAAIVAVAAGIWWVTKGKEQRLDQHREQAATHREEAQTAAQRAGEAEVRARQQAEEAERERERAMELQRKADDADPDTRT